MRAFCYSIRDINYREIRVCALYAGARLCTIRGDSRPLISSKKSFR